MWHHLACKNCSLQLIFTPSHWGCNSCPNHSYSLKPQPCSYFVFSLQRIKKHKFHHLIMNKNKTLLFWFISNLLVSLIGPPHITAQEGGIKIQYCQICISLCGLSFIVFFFFFSRIQCETESFFSHQSGLKVHNFHAQITLNNLRLLIKQAHIFYCTCNFFNLSY